MSERLRVVVMDDEPLARRRLERLVAAHPALQWVASYANPRQAGEHLGSVDLLFLDIEMPFESGYQWLDRLPLREVRALVVVTAHERHALPAIRREAVDFLLKPYDDVSFGLAVARALRRLRPPVLPVAGPASKRLELSGRDGLTWLDPAAIAWVQAAGKQVRIRHGGRTLLHPGTLAAFETRLADAGFVLVHRACIVNIAHVLERRPRAHGDAWLVLNDGSEVPLSRRYAAALARRMR